MNLNGLLVGLGNPGPEYRNTRHNLGFMLVDALLEQCPGADKLSSSKNRYELWRCKLPPLRGKGPSCGEWLLLKPLTYMNLSGEAVVPVAAYYKISPANIVVAHDELDLPLGRMRFKTGGGAAGHKGILSIAGLLGTPEFYRLRLGIGKNAGQDAVSHVLGRFRAEEEALIKQILDAGLETFLTFCSQGFAPAKALAEKFNPLETGQAGGK